MPTVATICNWALSRIGERSNITSLDDHTPNADACARFYPVALAAIMERHNWAFATTRQALAERADYPAKGPWLYAYEHPSDCHRIVNIEPRFDRERPDLRRPPIPLLTPPKIEFEVVSDPAGEVILTNVPAAAVRYIISDPAPGLFSAPFADALAWLLAGYLAGQFIRGESSAKFAVHCEQQYQLAFDQAVKWDARQQHKAKRHLPPWIVRRGWK